MSSILDYRYRINGVISTDKTVMQNMETLASAAGSWMSYDPNTGKWSVIINKSETSIFSFDDSNITGSITVNGTGLTDLYNSVRVEFPHIDLNDQLDYVSVTVPDIDRNANEPNNELQIQYDIINDPVHAEMLGFIELKQSRVDKVIRFTTDFSAMGLKAGDVIDITNTIYGFTNKLFRIVDITETDNDDGNILLSITALEYDENVYNTDDFYRYERSNSTGITTIGAIGIPGTPTVNKFETDARPRIFVETTSPTGLVEGMEFWITYDVPPAVTIDANRSYKLLNIVRPTVGNTFAYGTEVTLDYDTLSSGNFLIKTRGINSTTSGPFSDPTGTVYYAPVQVPNALTDDTIVDNGTGGDLLSALALTTLLGNLDKLFNSNVSISGGIGGVFDKIFSIFDETTGVDIRDPSVANALGQAENIMVSASAGTESVTGLAQVTSLTTMYTTPSFTPSVTGNYKFDIIIDQDTSGAVGGRGSDFSEPNDYVGVVAFLNDTTASTQTAIGSSGGTGAFYWTDYALTNLLALDSTHTYTLEFKYHVDTESNPSDTAGFTIGWNVYTVG